MWNYGDKTNCEKTKIKLVSSPLGDIECFYCQLFCCFVTHWLTMEISADLCLGKNSFCEKKYFFLYLR